MGRRPTLRAFAGKENNGGKPPIQDGKLQRSPGARSGSLRRESPVKEVDERDVERRLRQLAHKQMDVRARLLQLERERRHTSDRLHSEHQARCEVLLKERRQQVADFLTGEEGLEYLTAQQDKLTRDGQMSRECARYQVFDELMQDAKAHSEVKVREELHPQLVQMEREFKSRCKVLVQSLEDIEARAAPSLKLLPSLQEGSLVLSSSGFVPGLAAEAAASTSIGRRSWQGTWQKPEAWGH